MYPKGDSSASPTHCIILKDQIFAVEFFPYDWAQNLICIAELNKIVIASIKFSEEDDDLEDEYDFQVLREIHHESKVLDLAWSPRTQLSGLPKNVVFASAALDFNIRVFSSDLAKEDTVQILKGHKNFVNSIGFTASGEYLISGSDDHTCKIWQVEEDSSITLNGTLYMSSAVMTVCCHPRDPFRVLVAEMSGIISIYSLSERQAIWSVDVGIVPLMYADWSSENAWNAAAVAGPDLSVWNIEKTSRHTERAVHRLGARFVKFSHLNDSYIATVGEPDHLLQVTHVKSKRPVLISKLNVLGSLTWHYRLPYLCVSNYHKLCFWKIPIK